MIRDNTNLKTQTDMGRDIILSRLDELEKLIQKLIQEKTPELDDIKKDEVVIIKGQVNRAENIIEKWFEKLKGEILAQLDFIDKTTFGYLDSIPKNCGIRIITSNIKEVEVCIKKAYECAKDRPYFEIMQINKIHQRWIGSLESHIIEIGTDLKRESLGHSTHSIRKISPQNYDETIKQFQKLWRTPQKTLKKQYGEDFSKSLIFKTHSQ